MIGGIYSITNILNGDRYIGSTANFYKRKHTHKTLLNQGEHHSIHLQRAWDKYGGINGFSFEVLATCPKEYLEKLEQWFLDKLQPRYNIAITANSQQGIKRSEEYKEKLRQRQLNMPQETRDKIANTLTGRNHSEEARRKVSEFQKGKTKSIESRIKSSEAQRWFPDEMLIKVYQMYNDNYHVGVISKEIGRTLKQTKRFLDDKKYVLLKERLGLKKLINGKREIRLF